MSTSTTASANNTNPPSVATLVGNRLDGKIRAQAVRQELAIRVAARTAQGHRPPGLATVLVGEDPASQIYVANKRTNAAEVGITSFHHSLPADIDETTLLLLIDSLNDDERIDGILVQLPLPKHIDEARVIERILPSKDVDGFHPSNIADLAVGNLQRAIIPCTPAGCLDLAVQALGSSKELRGKHAVVIGRSRIVGRPMSYLLLAHDATVSICHSKTAHLAEITKQADILVAAAGIKHLVTADHVKEGAIVLDVGIHRNDNGKLTGDVDFASVAPRCRAITPVPGGVGPMTIAMLLDNTCRSHARRFGLA